MDSGPDELRPLREVLDRHEKAYLEQALLRCPDLAYAELAERLGLSLRTLQERLRAFGLSRMNRRRP